MKEFLRAKIFALSQYLEMLLSLILGPVSYTHLDVYKRQLAGDTEREEQ